MSLADEIFRALTGRTDRHAGTFADMLRELVEYRGITGISRRAQARQTGVPENTLRRWEKGDISPKGQAAAERRLTAAYRQAIASPGAVAAWQRNDFSLTLHNIPVKGRSALTADRTITAAKMGMQSGAGDAIVAAYMAGDDAQAARALAAGVTDPFYGDIVIRGWLAQGDDDLSGEGYDMDSDYNVYASAS